MVFIITNIVSIIVVVVVGEWCSLIYNTRVFYRNTDMGAK